MNPQSCEEAMQVAEQICDIKANTRLAYGNLFFLVTLLLLVGNHKVR